MKCYLVTMDFSLSAEGKLWGKRKLIGAFKFLVLNSFFLRTNFKHIIRQISRTSDNSWLKSVVLSYFLACNAEWSIFSDLVCVITDGSCNSVSGLGPGFPSWGQGFRTGVTPFTPTLTGSVPTNTCQTKAAARRL